MKRDYRIDRRALDTDDPALAWAVIKPIWTLGTAQDSAAQLPREWSDVTSGQLDVYAVTWVEREVINGGFWQYLWNTSADLPARAVEALERIEGPEYADLLKQAIAVFPGGVLPKTRDDRTRLLPEDPYYEDADGVEDEDVSPEHRKMLKTLDELDDRFYALYDKGHEFYRRIAEYVRAHPEEFFTGGPLAKC